MQLFENCLLASDIDGTLVETGKISDRNIEAINFFRKNGGTFVLSTGRCATALNQVFSVIDKSVIGPSVVLNGGMIYDYQQNRPIYSTYLSDSVKTFASDVIENLPEVGIEVHADALVYVLNKTEETQIHEEYEELECEFVTFDDVKDISWNKVLYCCKNQDSCDRLADFLATLNQQKDCSFIQTSIVVDGKRHLFYEQIPPNTTKATGLSELCRLLGIKKGGLFAIGDYYNDVEMLRAADISAAPSESPEEIKSLVNFVAGRCADGAVADFIEYLTIRRRKMDATKKKQLKIAACKIRRSIVDGVHSAKAGHPGGSLSIADLMAYLYFDKMNIDPENPAKADRDRFVLSKGHAAPALYATLAHRGFFPVSEMLTLRHTGARLQGHPDMKNIPGVDMSSGSLGQGISCAVGMALSAKHFGDNYRVYTVLGDGECEEGQVWEAAMFAGNKKLSNLTAYVDFNNLQIDGTCDEVNSPAPLDKKFEAFGWNVIVIDGHNFDEIEAATLAAEKVTDKPTAIIMNTVKGKGVSYMENACGWHGKAPGDADYEIAVKELDAALAELN